MENGNGIVSREKLDQVALWLSATVSSAFFSSLERFSCVNVTTDDDEEDDDHREDAANDPHPTQNDVANLPAWRGETDSTELSAVNQGAGFQLSNAVFCFSGLTSGLPEDDVVLLLSKAETFLTWKSSCDDVLLLLLSFQLPKAFCRESLCVELKGHLRSLKII
ncbi:hypothetical protein L484_007815 [Morus notabilis]|uniref:Uncharacterized protein n=1 Tax=Morus notabilis TaxID=981085 RepID=W9SKS9_9ROSA|nr:hypothetical protein L484_007815 [Morus notabilis]